jgi:tetratricopeptide repeat protein
LSLLQGKEQVACGPPRYDPIIHCVTEYTHMKTPIQNITLIALLLGIVQWAAPLRAQRGLDVPIRPHESESVVNLDVGGSDVWGNGTTDDDPRVRFARTKGIESDAISIHRAAHKPSKPARKKFDRGMGAIRKGRRAEAIQYLAAAVCLDPEYFNAHVYLGQLFLQEGEPLRGLAFIERALTIDSNSDILESNKAFALLALRRSAEAEQAARRAVHIAPRSIEAHYMLGLALLQQSRATTETVTHLEIAADKYPDARQGLAWVREQLARQKENSAARN